MPCCQRFCTEPPYPRIPRYEMDILGAPASRPMPHTFPKIGQRPSRTRFNRGFTENTESEIRDFRKSAVKRAEIRRRSRSGYSISPNPIPPDSKTLCGPSVISGSPKARGAKDNRPGLRLPGALFRPYGPDLPYRYRYRELSIAIPIAIAIAIGT